MPVGILKTDLYLPHCNSLKEKRKYLNRIKDRLRAKHNVAVGELDHQDIWQRSVLGVVTISQSRIMVEKILQKALAEIERTIPGDILATFQELVE